MCVAPPSPTKSLGPRSTFSAAGISVEDPCKKMGSESGAAGLRPLSPRGLTADTCALPHLGPIKHGLPKPGFPGFPGASRTPRTGPTLKKLPDRGA